MHRTDLDPSTNPPPSSQPSSSSSSTGPHLDHSVSLPHPHNSHSHLHAQSNIPLSPASAPPSSSSRSSSSSHSRGHHPHTPHYHTPHPTSSHSSSRSSFHFHSHSRPSAPSSHSSSNSSNSSSPSSNSTPPMARGSRGSRGEGPDPLFTAHAPSSPAPPSDEGSRTLPLSQGRASATSRTFADLQTPQLPAQPRSAGRSQQVLTAPSIPLPRGSSAPPTSVTPPTSNSSSSSPSHRMSGVSVGEDGSVLPSASVARVASAESLHSLDLLPRVPSTWHRSAAAIPPSTNGRGPSRILPNLAHSSSHPHSPISTHSPAVHSPSSSVSSLSSSYSLVGEEAIPSSHSLVADSSLASGWHGQIETGQRQRQRRKRGDSGTPPNGYLDHRSNRATEEVAPAGDSDSTSDASEHVIEPHGLHKDVRRRRRKGTRSAAAKGKWVDGRPLLTKSWWSRPRRCSVGSLLVVATFVALGVVGVYCGLLGFPLLLRSPPTEITVSFPIANMEAAALATRALLMPSTGTQPQGNSSLPVYVIASCANRLSSLQSCLPTWLAVPEVSSVVIVDWASSMPLHESLHENIEEAAGRLRVIRLEHFQPWELASSVNLALHFLPLDKPSLLLKVDCDTLLLPGFVVHHPLTPDMYYAGDWRIARTENELHLNGVLFLHTSNFVAVNGYDERLQSYGYDDTNLHERLNALPLTGEPLRYDYIQHLWHDDSVRAVEDRADTDKRKTPITIAPTVSQFNQLTTLPMDVLINVAPPFFATQRHRVLLNSVPRWSTAMTGAQFSVHKDENLPHVYFTRLTSSIQPLETLASPANQTAAINEAAQIALRRLGFRVDQLPRQLYGDSRYLLRLLSFYYTDSEQRSLVVEVQHGLSNRLRALASAVAVASELKLHLKVIWVPDHHCQAKFSDLFRLHSEVGLVRDSKDLHPIVKTLQQLRPHLVWEDVDWSPEPKLLSPEKFEIYNYMEHEGGKKDARIAVPTKDKSIFVKSAYRLNNDAGLTDFNLCKALSNLILSDLVIAKMNLTATPLGSSLTTQEAQASIPMLASMIGVHIRHQPPGKEISELNSREYSKIAWNALAEARNLSDIATYEGYIKEALKENGDQQFYISTDTPAIISELEKRYDHKMTYLSNKGCLNRSVECVQHALADQLLLGATTRILGSVWSSFSEMAGLWKMTPVVYPAEVDFRVNAVAAGKSSSQPYVPDSKPIVSQPAVAVIPASPVSPNLPSYYDQNAAVDESPFLSRALLKSGLTSPAVLNRALTPEDRTNDCTLRRVSLLGERCSGTSYLQRLLEANFNLTITHDYHYKHFFGFDDPAHPLASSQCTLFVGIIRHPIDWLDSFYKYQWQLDQWRYSSWNDFLTQPIISYVESEMNVTLTKIPEKDRFSMHQQMLTKELWHDRNFADPKVPNWKNIFELRSQKLYYQLHTFPKKVDNYVLVRLEDLKPNMRTFLGIVNSWFNVKRRRDPFIDAQMDDDILWDSMHGVQHAHVSDAVIDYAWQHLDVELEVSVGYQRMNHREEVIKKKTG